MSAKRNGRVQRSESAWQAILGRFDRSGQSQALFCKEAGISPSTFQVWRQKLGRRSLATEFVDVRPLPPSSLRWTIEITFPDGTTARVQG